MKTILHISWLLLRVIKSTSTSIPSHQSTLSLPQCVLIPFPPSLTAKASLFNNYFYSIFTRSSFVLPTTDDLPSVDSLISDVSVSDSDVYSELTKLDISKAMGIDNIGPKFLNSVLLFFTCQFTICFLSLCLISAYQPNGVSTPLFLSLNLAIELLS